jgi:hypothetical protein
MHSFNLLSIQQDDDGYKKIQELISVHTYTHKNNNNYIYVGNL